MQRRSIRTVYLPQYYEITEGKILSKLSKQALLPLVQHQVLSLEVYSTALGYCPKPLFLRAVRYEYSVQKHYSPGCIDVECCFLSTNLAPGFI